MILQDQIYVICGVCAGIFLLLFICIGYLLYRIAKITEILLGKTIEKRDTYAYNNPTIVAGEELNRRGYMMQNSSSSLPSSVNREPVAKLPRLDIQSGSSERPFKDIPQSDFANILNNSETIFGGDRPSNLNNRLKPVIRNQGANYDYNYRSSITNDNFSFQNSQDRNQEAPKTYLNERMQY